MAGGLSRLNSVIKLILMTWEGKWRTLNVQNKVFIVCNEGTLNITFIGAKDLFGDTKGEIRLEM